MKFWNVICGFVLLLTFSLLHCKAQNSADIKFQPKYDTSKNVIHPAPAEFTLFIFHPAVEKNFFTIPSNFATRYYGFFCKQELKVEKSIHVPIRVRLGSLQQCDYYEGKEKSVDYYSGGH